ncbi:unnamed protein product [Phytomonas sp. EM1]|nr:unnamed protein product [Phytomonas sp. EM1]|eukprot:CCW64731.1 unnamed protein product [Phytomonas sp. isolate EM1]
MYDEVHHVKDISMSMSLCDGEEISCAEENNCNDIEVNSEESGIDEPISDNDKCKDILNIINVAPEKTGYVVCELCNAIINTDMSLHIVHEHSEAYEAHPILTKCAESFPEMLDFGNFVYNSVYSTSLNENMFRIMQNTCEQLNNIQMDKYYVFPYGSCVSLGCWDGMSDGDFALISKASLEKQKEETKKTVIRQSLLYLMKKLRGIGFKFQELEGVFGARVPVVRRKCAVNRPYTRSLNASSYIIEYHFKDNKAHAHFVTRFNSIIEDDYHGVNIKEKDSRKLKEVYRFGKGVDAIRLFTQKEGMGVSKCWSHEGERPEIFSIDFDITCNIKGVRNSWFLRQYFAQNSLFRIGALFLKKWSKQCGINNSRRGYLTSYAINVMWVYFLLRSGHAEFVDPLKVSEFPTESQLSVTYMPLWERYAEDDHTEYISRLGKLLFSFFEFYTWFDWERHVISIRKDCSDAKNISTKVDFGWEKSRDVDLIKLKDRIFHGICIDDPYEKDLNLGRHLSPMKASWTVKQIRAAYGLCHQMSLHPGSFGGGLGYSLLLDPLLEKYEEVLRVAMYRHLVGSATGGMDTVGNLRKALKAAHGEALAGYEMHHRLSDLWFDVDQMIEDEGCLIACPSKRLFESPRQHPLSKAADPQGNKIWAAFSEVLKVPPKGITANDRVVFLANSDFYYSISNTDTLSSEISINNREDNTDHDKAKNNRSKNKVKSRPQLSMSSWSKELSRRVSQAKGIFQNALENLNPCTPKGEKDVLGLELVYPFDDPLVRLQFFCVGTRAFPTYHARNQMLEHLNAVARTLQKDETRTQIESIMDKEIIPVSDAQASKQNGGKKNNTTPKLAYKEGYRKRMLEAVSALIQADANNKLNTKMVTNILSSGYYVTQPVDPQRTKGKSNKNESWSATKNLLNLTVNKTG